MKTLKFTIFTSSLLLLGACAEEVPPVTVSQFMENPRLLEATMVRCGQNRSEMKYEVECVNARDAVNRLASAEEDAKRQHMEAQSERKRQALRRTQEAAAEARRRALEAQRAREEAEYLGLFEQLPDGAGTSAQPQAQANTPLAPSDRIAAETPMPVATTAVNESRTVDENVATTSAEDAPSESDLQSIREELRRRKENQE